MKELITAIPLSFLGFISCDFWCDFSETWTGLGVILGLFFVDEADGQCVFRNKMACGIALESSLLAVGKANGVAIHFADSLHARPTPSLRVFCEAKDEAISLTILNREIASLLASECASQ